MEVSSIPATPTTPSFFPSSRDLLKGVGLPTWRQSSISVALNGKRTQTLLHVTRSSFQNKGTLKVSSSLKSEPSILEARSMNEVYDSLALRLLPTAAVTSNPTLKYIVGLAGPPGAGKSTIAHEVAERINKMWPQKSPSMDEQVGSPDVAIVLPMDGFHLYRSQLDAMEDPKEAHARRGAPWTFDPSSLLKCLQTLKTQGSVCAPSFDHGVGDPIKDDIFVSLQIATSPPPHHRCTTAAPPLKQPARRKPQCTRLAPIAPPNRTTTAREPSIRTTKSRPDFTRFKPNAAASSSQYPTGPSSAFESSPTQPHHVLVVRI